MRILFPVQGVSAGVGSEDYMVDVARGLADRGHEVTLLLPRGSPLPSDWSSPVRYYRAEPSPGIVLWRVWMPLRVLYQILAALALRLPGYDVIVTGLLPTLFGLSFRMRRTPRIYLALSPLAWFEILSYGPSTLNLRVGAYVYHHLQRWAWRRSSAVVSFSAPLTEVRSRFFNAAPQGVVQAAPGVDFARFAPAERDLSLLAEFAIPVDAPLVVCFCRLIDSKDIPFLLRAFAAPEVPTTAHLLILGKGPASEPLRGLAEKLDVIDRVHFAGFRVQVEHYLRLGDVYAFPSRLESFGLTLAQAMAVGLPAVARRRSLPHVLTFSDAMIEPGKTGFLVDTEGEMARALRTLLTDAALRKQMSAEAALAARARFRWDMHLDGIERALTNVVVS